MRCRDARQISAGRLRQELDTLNDLVDDLIDEWHANGFPSDATSRTLDRAVANLTQYRLAGTTHP